MRAGPNDYQPAHVLFIDGHDSERALPAVL
jgi:hypothetical protein